MKFLQNILEKLFGNQYVCNVFKLRLICNKVLLKYKGDRESL